MSPIDMTLEGKACCACARAKRKCERQIPSCSRCQARGMRCEYPSAGYHQPFDRPQTRRQQVAAAVPDEPLSHVLFDLPDDLMAIDGCYLSHSLDTCTVTGNNPSRLSIESNHPRSQPHPLPCYLEEESWDIDHATSHNTAPFCSVVLKSFTDNTKEWLARWVETGACPFIHHRTYTHHIPRCVQDAYTALSTYQNVKQSNRGLVTNLVEQRIRQLLADQPPRPAAAGGGGGGGGAGSDEGDAGAAPALDTFEHLARVHALLTYQVIGLYDGDVRLRHVAETQIPTLNSWLRQLVASARRAAARGPGAFVSALVAPPGRCVAPAGPPAPPPPGDTAWYAWLFAETIRRTWLVASGVQTVYLTLQVLWAPCPGGLPFTTRGGAFDAASSSAWAASCGGHAQGLGFSRRHGHRLFQECRPEDVDEFTVRLLEISHGSERIERWRFGQ